MLKRPCVRTNLDDYFKILSSFILIVIIDVANIHLLFSFFSLHAVTFVLIVSNKMILKLFAIIVVSPRNEKVLLAKLYS